MFIIKLICVQLQQSTAKRPIVDHKCLDQSTFALQKFKLTTLKMHSTQSQFNIFPRANIFIFDENNFRFRNVVSAATRLATLVVRNICSDAMLKLIGAHCNILQYLVVANSKQVILLLFFYIFKYLKGIFGQHIFNISLKKFTQKDLNN